MSGKWLGHRDSCPTQWREKCTCPCSDTNCPGVDQCGDAACYVNSTASTEDTEDK